MMKERLVTPDVLVSLKSIKGLDQVKPAPGGGVTIGGLITLDALAARRGDSRALHGAGRGGRERGDAADPQRRRRWPATSASVRGAGTTATASSASRTAAPPAIPSPARTSSTRSSAADRATSCIPSDTAPALVALDATFRIVGPAGERTMPAAEFFTLPTADAVARERAGGRRDAGVDHAARRAQERPQHVSQGARSRSLDARGGQRGGRAGDGEGRLPQRARRARRRRADSVAAARGREDAGRSAAARRSWRRRPARRRSAARGRSRKTPTRCR